MKNILTATAIALTFICAGTATAQFKGNLAPAPIATQNQGGFKGPSTAVTTVAEALNAKDETVVVLTGKIEKEIAHEKYQFTDNTGTIVIEIDNEDWRGVEVTPTDTIEIRGETDKDLVGDATIDVDSVVKK